MKNIFNLFFLIYFISMGSAHAYLDPGTGSIIIQTILGAIGAGAAYMGLHWQRLKNYLSKIKETKNLKKK